MNRNGGGGNQYANRNQSRFEGDVTQRRGSPQHVCGSKGNGFVEFELAAIEQSIGARFEQQVARHADCLAVSTRTQRITYAELNHEANRIAAAIQTQRGPGPEPVALLFGQGSELIAAILAVLKTGKAYMALDPTYPPARLAAMLDDAEARFLVADAPSLPLARSLVGEERSLLPVDEARDRGAGNPAVEVSPDATAYVFYTSGSTGQPKGVCDTHRNVLHNILRYTNALQVGPDDRLTLLQSCSFSGSVSSLFCALLNGAAIFPFDVQRESPRPLAKWLREERITMYHSVPTIFRSFLSGTDGFPDVRCIRLEGDRSSRLDVDLFRDHFDPGCLLVNGLGTTETGIVRQLFIDHETAVDDGILPVGYPVPDMDVIVLNAKGDEADLGQVGEIAVRSEYLASGYWRRPDLTEAAFRPDPAGGRGRVYRTGDMGRLRADGCLEYLGRADFMLKVRGNRIEPAEIETALLRLPELAEVVVTTLEGDREEVQLVAYYVPRAGNRPSATLLHRRLSETLPAFMIPSSFVPLDAFPLDANGKLDRRALPAPARPAGAGRTPRGALEERVAHVFESVLGLEQIGSDGSFFDLGGDSLAAAEICAQLAAETGFEVTASALLDAPTVESLAALLGSGVSNAASPIFPVQVGGSLPPLFLVGDFMGRLGYSGLARLLGRDQPVWGLVSHAGTERLIPTLAARYVEAIRRVQPTGPYRLGGWCFSAVVAFEMAQQLHANAEEIAFLGLLGVSPHDFPTLVAPSARRRYLRSHDPHLLSRVVDHVARARAMNLRAGSSYLVRKSSRVPRLVDARLPRRTRADPAEADDFSLYLAMSSPGRVALFLAEEETAAYSRDPASDWQGLSTVAVDVHQVPGDRYEMLLEPRVGELARLLALSLAQALPIT